MGMNCHKCGTLLPAEAAYCPSCGAPRSEIEHFVRETERAVLLALTTGTEALDRGDWTLWNPRPLADGVDRLRGDGHGGRAAPPRESGGCPSRDVRHPGRRRCGRLRAPRGTSRHRVESGSRHRDEHAGWPPL